MSDEQWRPTLRAPRRSLKFREHRPKLATASIEIILSDPRKATNACHNEKFDSDLNLPRSTPGSLRACGCPPGSSRRISSPGFMPAGIRASIPAPSIPRTSNSAVVSRAPGPASPGVPITRCLLDLSLPSKIQVAPKPELRARVLQRGQADCQRGSSSRTVGTSSGRSNGLSRVRTSLGKPAALRRLPVR